jgi:hypothetical protein
MISEGGAGSLSPGDGNGELGKSNLMFGGSFGVFPVKNVPLEVS